MNFFNKYLTKKNLVIWGIAQTISLMFCLFAFWFGYSFFYGRYQQQPLNQNVYSKIVQERNYNLVIALILVLLSSAIDNHLWDMAFNIVFLGMFADVQSDNEIVGIENESNTK